MSNKILALTKRSIKQALKIREFDPSKGYLRIPGMVSYVERENLYRRSKSLTGKGHALEFGAYFGASTASILQGLRECDFPMKLHVFDVFRTRNAWFADLTRQLAKGLEHHLVMQDGWLDFYGVFRAHVDDSMVVVHRDFVSELNWTDEPVEFLHLDLPKDWKQAKYIADQVFTCLVPGAHVIFQDFSYQWAAELIAMVGQMHKSGLLRLESLDETTLSAVLLRKIEISDLNALGAEMSDQSKIISNLDDAIKAASPMMRRDDQIITSVARSIFVYQHDPEEALRNLSDVFGDIAVLSPRVKAAFKEAMRFGMNMPKSWE